MFKRLFSKKNKDESNDSDEEEASTSNPTFPNDAQDSMPGQYLHPSPWHTPPGRPPGGYSFPPPGAGFPPGSHRPSRYSADHEPPWRRFVSPKASSSNHVKDGSQLPEDPTTDSAWGYGSQDVLIKDSTLSSLREYPPADIHRKLTTANAAMQCDAADIDKGSTIVPKTSQVAPAAQSFGWPTAAPAAAVAPAGSPPYQAVPLLTGGPILVLATPQTQGPFVSQPLVQMCQPLGASPGFAASPPPPSPHGYTMYYGPSYQEPDVRPAVGGRRVVKGRRASVWIPDRRDESPPPTAEDIEDDLDCLLDRGVYRSSGPQTMRERERRPHRPDYWSRPYRSMPPSPPPRPRSPSPPRRLRSLSPTYRDYSPTTASYRPEPCPGDMEEYDAMVDGNYGHEATMTADHNGVAAGGTRVVRRRQASIWLRDKRDGSPHSVEEVEQDLQRLLDTGIQRSSSPQGDSRVDNVPRSGKHRSRTRTKRAASYRKAIVPTRADDTPSDISGTPDKHSSSDDFEEEVRVAVEKILALKKEEEKLSRKRQPESAETNSLKSSQPNSLPDWSLIPEPRSTIELSNYDQPISSSVMANSPRSQDQSAPDTEKKAEELLTEMRQLQQSMAELLQCKSSLQNNVELLLQSKASLQNHLRQLKDELHDRRQPQHWDTDNLRIPSRGSSRGSRDVSCRTSRESITDRANRKEKKRAKRSAESGGHNRGRESAERPYSPSPQHNASFERLAEEASRMEQTLQNEKAAVGNTLYRDAQQTNPAAEAVASQGFEVCSMCDRPHAECICEQGSQNNNSDRPPDSGKVFRSNRSLPGPSSVSVHMKSSTRWRADPDKTSSDESERRFPKSERRPPPPESIENMRNRAQRHQQKIHMDFPSSVGAELQRHDPARQKLPFAGENDQFCGPPSQVDHVKGTLRSESSYENEIQKFPDTHTERRRGTMETRALYDEEVNTSPALLSDFDKHRGNSHSFVKDNHVSRMSRASSEPPEYSKSIPSASVGEKLDRCHIVRDERNDSTKYRSYYDEEVIRSPNSWRISSSELKYTQGKDDGNSSLSQDDMIPQKDIAPERYDRQNVFADSVPLHHGECAYPSDGINSPPRQRRRIARYRTNSEPSSHLTRSPNSPGMNEQSRGLAARAAVHSETCSIQTPRKPQPDGGPWGSHASTRDTMSPRRLPDQIKVPDDTIASHYVERIKTSSGTKDNACCKLIESGVTPNLGRWKYERQCIRMKTCPGLDDKLDLSREQMNQRNIRETQDMYTVENLTHQTSFPSSQSSFARNQQMYEGSRSRTGGSPYFDTVQRDAAASESLRSPRLLQENRVFSNEGSWDAFTASGKRLPPPLSDEEIIASKYRHSPSKESRNTPEMSPLEMSIRRAMRKSPTIKYPKKHNCLFKRTSRSVSPRRPLRFKDLQRSSSSEYVTTHFSRWAEPPVCKPSCRQSQSKRSSCTSPRGRRRTRSAVSGQRSSSNVSTRTWQEPPKQQVDETEAQMERTQHSSIVARFLPKEFVSREDPYFADDDTWQVSQAEQRGLSHTSRFQDYRDEPFSRSHYHRRPQGYNFDFAERINASNNDFPQVQITIGLTSPPPFFTPVPRPRPPSPSPPATDVTVETESQCSSTTVELVTNTRHMITPGPSNSMAIQPAAQCPATLNQFDCKEMRPQTVTDRNIELQHGYHDFDHHRVDYSMLTGQSGDQREPKMHVEVTINIEPPSSVQPQDEKKDAFVKRPGHHHESRKPSYHDEVNQNVAVEKTSHDHKSRHGHVQVIEHNIESFTMEAIPQTEHETLAARKISLEKVGQICPSPHQHEQTIEHDVETYVREIVRSIDDTCPPVIKKSTEEVSQAQAPSQHQVYTEKHNMNSFAVETVNKVDHTLPPVKDGNQKRMCRCQLSQQQVQIKEHEIENFTMETVAETDHTQVSIREEIMERTGQIHAPSHQHTKEYAVKDSSANTVTMTVQSPPSTSKENVEKATQTHASLPQRAQTKEHGEKRFIMEGVTDVDHTNPLVRDSTEISLPSALSQKHVQMEKLTMEPVKEIDHTCCTISMETANHAHVPPQQRLQMTQQHQESYAIETAVTTLDHRQPPEMTQQHQESYAIETAVTTIDHRQPPEIAQQYQERYTMATDVTTTDHKQPSEIAQQYQERYTMATDVTTTDHKQPPEIAQQYQERYTMATDVTTTDHKQPPEMTQQYQERYKMATDVTTTDHKQPPEMTQQYQERYKMATDVTTTDHKQPPEIAQQYQERYTTATDVTTTDHKQPPEMTQHQERYKMATDVTTTDHKQPPEIAQQHQERYKMATAVATTDHKQPPEMTQQHQERYTMATDVATTDHKQPPEMRQQHQERYIMATAVTTTDHKQPPEMTQQHQESYAMETAVTTTNHWQSPKLTQQHQESYTMETAVTTKDHRQRPEMTQQHQENYTKATIATIDHRQPPEMTQQHQESYAMETAVTTTNHWQPPKLTQQHQESYTMETAVTTKDHTQPPGRRERENQSHILSQQHLEMTEDEESFTMETFTKTEQTQSPLRSVKLKKQTHKKRQNMELTEDISSYEERPNVVTKGKLINDQAGRNMANKVTPEPEWTKTQLRMETSDMVKQKSLHPEHEVHAMQHSSLVMGEYYHLSEDKSIHGVPHSDEAECSSSTALPEMARESMETDFETAFESATQKSETLNFSMTKDSCLGTPKLRPSAPQLVTETKACGKETVLPSAPPPEDSDTLVFTDIEALEHRPLPRCEKQSSQSPLVSDLLFPQTHILSSRRMSLPERIRLYSEEKQSVDFPPKSPGDNTVYHPTPARRHTYHSVMLADASAHTTSKEKKSFSPSGQQENSLKYDFSFQNSLAGRSGPPEVIPLQDSLPASEVIPLQDSLPASVEEIRHVPTISVLKEEAKFSHHLLQRRHSTPPVTSIPMHGAEKDRHTFDFLNKAKIHNVHSTTHKKSKSIHEFHRGKPILGKEILKATDEENEKSEHHDEPHITDKHKKKRKKKLNISTDSESFQDLQRTMWCDQETTEVKSAVPITKEDITSMPITETRPVPSAPPASEVVEIHSEFPSTFVSPPQNVPEAQQQFFPATADDKQHVSLADSPALEKKKKKRKKKTCQASPSPSSSKEKMVTDKSGKPQVCHSSVPRVMKNIVHHNPKTKQIFSPTTTLTVANHVYLSPPCVEGIYTDSYVKKGSGSTSTQHHLCHCPASTQTSSSQLADHAEEDRPSLPPRFVHHGVIRGQGTGSSLKKNLSESPVDEDRNYPSVNAAGTTCPLESQAANSAEAFICSKCSEKDQVCKSNKNTCDGQKKTEGSRHEGDQNQEKNATLPINFSCNNQPAPPNNFDRYLLRDEEYSGPPCLGDILHGYECEETSQREGSNDTSTMPEHLPSASQNVQSGALGQSEGVYVINPDLPGSSKNYAEYQNQTKQPGVKSTHRKHRVVSFEGPDLEIDSHSAIFKQNLLNTEENTQNLSDIEHDTQKVISRNPGLIFPPATKETSQSADHMQLICLQHHMKMEKLRKKIKELKDMQKELIQQAKTDCVSIVDQEVKVKDAQLLEERISKAKLKEAIVSLQRQLTDMERETWKTTLNKESAQQNLVREKRELECHLDNIQREAVTLRAEKEDLVSKLEKAQNHEAALELQLNDARWNSQEKEVLSTHQAAEISNYKNLVDLCHQQYEQQRDTATRLQEQLNEVARRLEEKDKESVTMRQQLDVAKNVISKRRHQLEEFKMMSIRLRDQCQKEQSLSALMVKEKKAVEDKLHLETTRYSSLVAQVDKQNKRLMNVRSKVESLDPSRLRHQFEVHYRAQIDLVLRQVSNILEQRESVAEAAEMMQQEMDFRQRAHQSTLQLSNQRNKQIKAMMKATRTERHLLNDIRTAGNLSSGHPQAYMNCSATERPNTSTYTSSSMPSKKMRFISGNDFPEGTQLLHSNLQKESNKFVPTFKISPQTGTLNTNSTEKDMLEIRLQALKQKSRSGPSFKTKDQPELRNFFPRRIHAVKAESRSFLADIKHYPRPGFSDAPVSKAARLSYDTEKCSLDPEHYFSMSSAVQGTVSSYTVMSATYGGFSAAGSSQMSHDQDQRAGNDGQPEKSPQNDNTSPDFDVEMTSQENCFVSLNPGGESLAQQRNEGTLTSQDEETALDPEPTSSRRAASETPPDQVLSSVGGKSYASQSDQQSHFSGEELHDKKINRNLHYLRRFSDVIQPAEKAFPQGRRAYSIQSGQNSTVTFPLKEGYQTQCYQYSTSETKVNHVKKQPKTAERRQGSETGEEIKHFVQDGYETQASQTNGSREEIEHSVNDAYETQAAQTNGFREETRHSLDNDYKIQETQTNGYREEIEHSVNGGYETQATQTSGSTHGSFDAETADHDTVKQDSNSGSGSLVSPWKESFRARTGSTDQPEHALHDSFSSSSLVSAWKESFKPQTAFQPGDHPEHGSGKSSGSSSSTWKESFKSQTASIQDPDDVSRRRSSSSDSVWKESLKSQTEHNVHLLDRERSGESEAISEQKTPVKKVKVMKQECFDKTQARPGTSKYTDAKRATKKSLHVTTNSREAEARRLVERDSPWKDHDQHDVTYRNTTDISWKQGPPEKSEIVKKFDHHDRETDQHILSLKSSATTQISFMRSVGMTFHSRTGEEKPYGGQMASGTQTGYQPWFSEFQGTAAVQTSDASLETECHHRQIFPTRPRNPIQFTAQQDAQVALQSNHGTQTFGSTVSHATGRNRTTIAESPQTIHSEDFASLTHFVMSTQTSPSLLSLMCDIKIHNDRRMSANQSMTGTQTRPSLLSVHQRKEETKPRNVVTSERMSGTQTNLSLLDSRESNSILMMASLKHRTTIAGTQTSQSSLIVARKAQVSAVKSVPVQKKDQHFPRKRSVSFQVDEEEIANVLSKRVKASRGQQYNDQTKRDMYDSQQLSRETSLSSMSTAVSDSDMTGELPWRWDDPVDITNRLPYQEEGQVDILAASSVRKEKTLPSSSGKKRESSSQTSKTKTDSSHKKSRKLKSPKCTIMQRGVQCNTSDSSHPSDIYSGLPSLPSQGHESANTALDSQREQPLNQVTGLCRPDRIQRNVANVGLWEMLESIEKRVQQISSQANRNLDSLHSQERTVPPLISNQGLVLDVKAFTTPGNEKAAQTDTGSFFFTKNEVATLSAKERAILSNNEFSMLTRNNENETSVNSSSLTFLSAQGQSRQFSNAVPPLHLSGEMCQPDTQPISNASLTSGAQAMFRVQHATGERPSGQAESGLLPASSVQAASGVLQTSEILSSSRTMNSVPMTSSPSVFHANIAAAFDRSETFSLPEHSSLQPTRATLQTSQTLESAMPHSQQEINSTFQASSHADTFQMSAAPLRASYNAQQILQQTANTTLASSSSQKTRGHVQPSQNVTKCTFPTARDPYTAPASPAPSSPQYSVQQTLSQTMVAAVTSSHRAHGHVQDLRCSEDSRYTSSRHPVSSPLPAVNTGICPGSVSHTFQPSSASVMTQPVNAVPSSSPGSMPASSSVSPFPPSGVTTYSPLVGPVPGVMHSPPTDVMHPVPGVRTVLPGVLSCPRSASRPPSAGAVNSVPGVLPSPTCGISAPSSPCAMSVCPGASSMSSGVFTQSSVQCTPLSPPPLYRTHVVSAPVSPHCVNVGYMPAPCQAADTLQSTVLFSPPSCMTPFSPPAPCTRRVYATSPCQSPPPVTCARRVYSASPCQSPPPDPCARRVYSASPCRSPVHTSNVTFAEDAWYAEPYLPPVYHERTSQVVDCFGQSSGMVGDSPVSQNRSHKRDKGKGVGTKRSGKSSPRPSMKHYQDTGTSMDEIRRRSDDEGQDRGIGRTEITEQRTLQDGGNVMSWIPNFLQAVSPPSTSWQVQGLGSYNNTESSADRNTLESSGQQDQTKEQPSGSDDSGKDPFIM